MEEELNILNVLTPPISEQMERNCEHSTRKKKEVERCEQMDSVVDKCNVDKCNVDKGTDEETDVNVLSGDNKVDVDIEPDVKANDVNLQLCSFSLVLNCCTSNSTASN
jgi:hypothetical protein